MTVGKLDDIELGRLLGNIESKLGELDNRAREDRETANERHVENQRAILAATAQMQRLDAKVEPLTKVDAKISDLAMQIRDFDHRCINCLMKDGPPQNMADWSRSRLVAMATIGISAMAAFAWGLEALAKWAITWAHDHFH